MDALGGVASRDQGSGRSKEWLEAVNKVLQVVGGFLFINGIYFSLFATSILTAIVYYSFVLMILSGLGYYFLSIERLRQQLRTWQAVMGTVMGSFELPEMGSFELPEISSTPERRRRL